MTTEPGILPKLYDKLEFDRISPDLQNALCTVKKEVKVLAVKMEKIME